MSRSSLFRSAAIASLAISVAACGTIMHGGSQGIGFSSSPSSARVIVDGVPAGTTPSVTKLKRGKNHIVRMELDGYQPFESTITHSVSGWVWGNIVFGGLIGLVVDASTGGLYKLSPEQVNGQMAVAHASIGQGKDDLYLAVVLKADPSWQKVGQLAR